MKLCYSQGTGFFVIYTVHVVVLVDRSYIFVGLTFVGYEEAPKNVVNDHLFENCDNRPAWTAPERPKSRMLFLRRPCPIIE